MKRLSVAAAMVGACGLAACWAVQAGGQSETKPAKTVTTSPEGCVVEKFTVHSPSMKRDIRAVVVLPQEYADNPDKRYPVLHTLHGMGAPYTTFSDMSPLRKALKTMPMIVTCFDGDRAGWYIDSTVKPDSKFTTFFFDEFIPYVDKHYRTNGRRGVTGFSMGGYGAMHYMLTKPEMFASVSSLSGAFRFFDGREGRPPSGFKGLLGDYEKNKAAYEACAIYGRIEQYVARNVKLPPMMMHCGTEDGLLKANRELRDFLIAQNKLIRQRLAKQIPDDADARTRRGKMAELFAKEGIEFDHHESPGGHNWTFWKTASRGVVEFHWRSFQK